MSTNSNTISVTYAHISELINGCFCIHLKLLNKIVIWFFSIFGYNRHFCIIKYSITLRYIK